jgi:hypothetical protein
MVSLLLFLPLTLAAPTKRATNQLIYSTRDNLCLGIQDGTLTSGTRVISVPCERAVTWDIDRGSGSIVISGTKLALDAGVRPDNGGALKVCRI